MYRREESFRFKLEPVIAGKFRIVTIGAHTRSSKYGSAQLLDISPSGIKIVSELDIPVEKEVKIEVVFILNQDELVFIGQLVWKKAYLNDCQYGVKLLISDDQQATLVSELKQYARKITSH